MEAVQGKELDMIFKDDGSLEGKGFALVRKPFDSEGKHLFFYAIIFLHL